MTSGPAPDPTTTPTERSVRQDPGRSVSGHPGHPGQSGRRPGIRVAAALAADILLVVAFVLVGRGNHHSGGGLSGFAETALPFLAGNVVGWLLGRAWFRPLAVVPTGVVVWAATVIGGLAIRAAWGGGFAVSFAIVTTIVLGVFLVGWRLLAAAIRRRGSFGSARRLRRSAR